MENNLAVDVDDNHFILLCRDLVCILIGSFFENRHWDFISNCFFVIDMTIKCQEQNTKEHLE